MALSKWVFRPVERSRNPDPNLLSGEAAAGLPPRGRGAALNSAMSHPPSLFWPELLSKAVMHLFTCTLREAQETGCQKDTPVNPQGSSALRTRPSPGSS